MAPYIVLTIVVLLLGLPSINEDQRNRIVYYRIIFFLMFLIVGLRSIDVGIDTRSYVQYYDYFNSIPFGKVLFGHYSFQVERIWALINQIIGAIFQNYQFLLIFSSAIYFYGAYYYTKEVGEIDIIVLLTFLYNGLFIQSMNLMRQYVAIGLLMIGWTLTKKGFKKRAVILFALAVCIHRSAILFVLFVIFTLIKNYRYRRFITIIGIIAAIVIVVFYDTIMPYVFSSEFSGWYGKYRFRYQDVEVGFTRYLWVAELILGILAYRYKNRIKADSIEELGENQVNLLFIIAYFILCILSLRFSLLGRIARYFQIATLSIYDDFLGLLKDRFGTVVYVLSYFIVICLLTTVFLVSVYNNLRQYNYAFFWNGG